MTFISIWLTIGLILGIYKRVKLGRPLFVSNYFGLMIMWPFVYFFKLMDRRI